MKNSSGFGNERNDRNAGRHNSGYRIKSWQLYTKIPATQAAHPRGPAKAGPICKRGIAAGTPTVSHVQRIENPVRWKVAYNCQNHLSGGLTALHAVP